MILPILILVEILSVINLVNAFDCNLICLNTNKTKYYRDEFVKINASWIMNYDDKTEIAYTQIHITDFFDNFVWNSSKYYQIGLHQGNWTVNFEDLNLSIENSSHILFIKFFVSFFHIDTSSTMCYYLETIEIRVMKRNISCELIGYKDQIKVGEDLSLIAKFYSKFSEHNQLLINQTIDFMVSFNDLIIYQKNYMTNSSGVIQIYLISLKHLKLGKNILTFSITNNNLYNDSKFVYEIYVDKYDLVIEVVDFNNRIEIDEDLDIKLSLHYNINQSDIILVNYKILIKIFDNKSLTFINEYWTDKSGVLEISISQNSFNYNQEIKDFIIKIFLNESNYFNNETLILNLDVHQNIYSKILNSFQMKIFSFTSILIAILIFLSYIIINKKSKNEKALTELIIRY
ncbi:MAG: hypothetical protein ACFFA4_01605 [Promethearchaeota archaeon]